MRQAVRALVRDPGSVTLEMAVVMPLLLLFLMTLIQLSILFGVQNAVTVAAQEGARAGAVTGSVSACRSEATDVAQMTVKAAGRGSVRCQQRGEIMEAVVEYRTPVIVPMLSAFLGKEVAVTGVARFRVES